MITLLKSRILGFRNELRENGIGKILIFVCFALAVLGLLIYLIVSIGQVMLDPFEGTPHDTPMSSIIRTIEIISGISGKKLVRTLIYIDWFRWITHFADLTRNPQVDSIT